MIQVFLGLTKNSVLMDGKGPNLHLPKYMQPNMYPLGCKGIKRSIQLNDTPTIVLCVDPLDHIVMHRIRLFLLIVQCVCIPFK